MSEAEKALQSAMADISAENLKLRTSHAAVDEQLHALRAHLLESNTRLASCTAAVLTLSRESAKASSQSLVEAQAAALPAVIEAATKADEAAIASLGGTIELQSCLRWAMDAARAIVAAPAGRAT